MGMRRRGSSGPSGTSGSEGDQSDPSGPERELVSGWEEAEDGGTEGLQLWHREEQMVNSCFYLKDVLPSSSQPDNNNQA